MALLDNPTNLSLQFFYVLPLYQRLAISINHVPRRWWVE